jgi:subtilisin family serine protease
VATARGAITAFVELARKPAVDAFTEKENAGAGKDAAKQAARDARNDVSAAADQVVGQLRSADGATKELYRTANGVPGVVVTADAAKVRELANRPDVASVHTVVPKKRTNSSAVQLTQTLATWQQYGKFGDDVRIGVVDTGVDYTHADFGGPGTVEAFEAVDPRAETDAFPTAKVVGGYDFAGEDYDAQDPESVPAPDPNPLDCDGHGTHVAGSAAGFGVTADGATFTGDYRTLDAAAVNDMKIGPGTAPKALLYALKVFGCAGSTNVTSRALDWALDPDGDGDFSDHLDVVNLSLGSDYGAPDDPDSLFVRKLNAVGVLTVFAAGNGGDLYDVGGSPGATPEALTVASTRDAYVLRDAAEAVAPADVAGPKAGQYSQSFTGYRELDLTAPVAPVSAGNADGCAAFSPADAAAVTGKIAWLEWDDSDATRRCGSGARVTNAQNAGAVGVVLTSALEHFNAGIAGNAGVPAVQLTGSATASLRPALAAGTLTLRLAGELRNSLETEDPAITDTPSSFTSRGNRGPVVKPDVAAPGDTISSAQVGSGDDRSVLSGTSMAAPHTAGIAALVRQVHPDWTPEEVKAAVMNTAGTDVRFASAGTGPIGAPNRVGTGRIDASAALDNQVLAYVQDDPGAVSVSFGTVEVAKKLALTKILKIVNKGTAPVVLDARYEAITEIPGVAYLLSEKSVRLSPRGVARIKVTLTIDDPAALRKTVDPTVQALQLDVPRQFLADASGRVVLTPTSGSSVPLRVPVYSAPKPVSAISTPGSVRVPKRGDAVLPLSGKGLDQGSGTQAYRSLVSVLELQGTSPRLPDCRRNVTENCALNQTAKGADLRYVGVTSTAPQARADGRPEEALLGFGVATWGTWYNLGVNTVPYVDVDTTGDGLPDFQTYATRLTDTDVLVAATVDLATGETVDVQPVNGQFGDVDTNTFDTDVVVLPVLLTALGVDPAASSARISYTAATTGFYLAPGATTSTIDAIGTPMSFDVLAPGLYAEGARGVALLHEAKPFTFLNVRRDAAALAKDRTDSLLVLNLHNATGERASVVKVRGGGDGRAS